MRDGIRRVSPTYYKVAWAGRKRYFPAWPSGRAMRHHCDTASEAVEYQRKCMRRVLKWTDITLS